MIYKKILYLFIIFTFLGLSSFAIEKASIKYDEDLIDYNKLNATTVLQEADYFFKQYESTQDKKYLSTAVGKYYIVTKIHPYEMYPTIQLARTYDHANLDRIAKEYFGKGYNINKKDPALNYYYGEFYYRRDDYKRALRFYKYAYNNGYSNSYDLNKKIATIYEKFADLKNAQYYYKKAHALNTEDAELNDKILQINSLNYDKSEYYHSIRE